MLFAVYFLLNILKLSLFFQLAEEDTQINFLQDTSWYSCSKILFTSWAFSGSNFDMIVAINDIHGQILTKFAQST